MFSEGLFSVLECSPLHTRILCCLELMDITKQCGSFSVMLCQALMCSGFWLLLVSGFLGVFFPCTGEKHAHLNRDPETHSTTFISLLWLIKLLGYFCYNLFKLYLFYSKCIHLFQSSPTYFYEQSYHQ